MQHPDRRLDLKSVESPLHNNFLFEMIFHPRSLSCRIWLTVTFITCFELYLKANDGHFDVTYGPGPDGSLRVSLTCRLTQMA